MTEFMVGDLVVIRKAGDKSNTWVGEVEAIDDDGIHVHANGLGNYKASELEFYHRGE